MVFELKVKSSEAERHLSDITTLLFDNDRLYSGADDGKIKIWNSDLKLQAEIEAHPVNVYSLAISGDTLYSSSNDGTIKAWNVGLWTLKKVLLDNPNDEVLKLRISNSKLYSGDDKGMIRIWQNDNEVGKIEVGEEVWDLAVVDKILLTVRNLDVSILEMVGDKSQYTFRASLLGRSPLCIVKDKLCFLSRCGKIINIHEFDVQKQFPKVTQIEGHDLIINSLCFSDTPDTIIFSGGYDNIIKGWKLSDQSLMGSIKIDTVVNTMCTDKMGNIFVGSSYGYLAKISTL
uniref:WD repeat-containing protein 55 homolog n=1 Tax=Clastoptera arizonana TaxID=38151 RepID=A0A1B6CTC2_9HEMI